MIYSRIDSTEMELGRIAVAQEHLLATVGSSSFGNAVAKAVGVFVDVSEFLAFCRTALEAPRILLSEGDGGKAINRANAYSSRYFRFDPLNRLLDPKTPSGTYVARVRSDEILYSDYRQLCYVRPGFTEKLTLARKVEQNWIVLSLFAKDRNAGFSQDEVDRACRFGQLFLPILGLHRRLLGGNLRHGSLSVLEVEARLRMAFPELTKREISVCARSLVGVTAEGIALDLGIKQTSVLTYRRRAYERLNINSVHQLTAMILQ